jgi:hypothetical protein
VRNIQKTPHFLNSSQKKKKDWTIENND